MRICDVKSPGSIGIARIDPLCPFPIECHGEEPSCYISSCTATVVARAAALTVGATTMRGALLCFSAHCGELEGTVVPLDASVVPREHHV